MIEVTQETKSDWCVVAISGRADAEAADQLESSLRAAIDTHTKVAANLADVDYISSAGLRAIIQAARAAQAKHGEFVVCSLTPSVKKVFDMSGMHHIMRIHGDLPC
jgi:anti-sigma B factor antagonist